MQVTDLIGKVPEIPFKVSVEDSSIMKLGVAAVMVAAIIILMNVAFKTKK